MKRFFVMIIALILILSGCGSTPNQGSTQTPDTPASGEQPVQNQNSGTAPAEKQVMTAMFLGSSQDQPVVDIIQDVTTQFNADNPYNVEFKFETYENEQYKTKLSTVMASNSAPDVFFTWSAGYLKPFVEGGKVYEIGGLLASDAEWMGRFNDGVFGPVTYDGKIYAVPHGQSVGVMYYNTRMFAENNLAVPKTVDELNQICETFIAKGIKPISVPVKDAWIAGQLLQQLANSVGGISLYNETLSGAARWDDARYVDSGKLLTDFVNMGAFPDGYLGMTYDEGRELFAQEKVPMFYMGSWDISVLSEPDVPVAKNIGVFAVPPMKSGDGVIAIGDVDQCLAISSNCINVEAAKDYIKIFSDTAAQEAYAYNANYLLSTKTPLDSGKCSPLFLEVNNLQQSLSGVTPWLDRVFGAGEGVEFNNAAQAIIAGKDPAEQMGNLQQFAEDNALR